jgi:hypothetical protein
MGNKGLQEILKEVGSSCWSARGLMRMGPGALEIVRWRLGPCKLWRYQSRSYDGYLSWRVGLRRIAAILVGSLELYTNHTISQSDFRL